MAEEEKKRIILFVDDEPEIQDVYTEVAEALGAKFLFAIDGPAALEALSENAKNIAVIVSDYRMPGMSGMELRQEVLKRSPDLAFVLVSGFLSKEDVLKAMANKVAAFIEKPFQVEDMIGQVGRVFSERKAALDEDDELLEGFVGEAEMLLEEVDGLLGDIEPGKYDVGIFDRIFAVIHTIKGAGGFFNPLTIHHYAHAFEDFLTLMRDGKLPVSKGSVGLMYFAVDKIVHFVEDLNAGRLVDLPLADLGTEFKEYKEGDSAPVKDGSAGDSKESADADPGGKKVQAKTRDEVKVSIRDLDDFMEKSGEITVLRNMIIQLVRTIEKTYGGNKDILLLAELLDEMHKVNSAIQDKIVDLRKVPMRTIYRPLTRVVRELAPKLKKQVEINCEGQDILVDTSIAEVLNSSLTHMIKNCLDHGIETPEEREKVDKSKVGNIHLVAEEVDDKVVLSVDDDGRGLDPDRIRAKMLENGMKTEAELEEMSEEEILGSIFEPGFSTSENVTEISGRGVGTDMLKGSVEKIGGKIEVNSILGEGTKFTLHLPIPKSVVIINSLFVSAGSEIFAIPQDDIVRVLRMGSKAENQMIFNLEGGGRSMLNEGIYLPILKLSQILDVREGQNGAELEKPLGLAELGPQASAQVSDEVAGRSEETVAQSQELQVEAVPGESLKPDDIKNVSEELARKTELKITSQQQSSDEDNFIMIATKNYEYVLEVDAVLDIEDTVVKVVKNGVHAMALFQGATFLGDGRLGLILAVDEIAKMSELEPKAYLTSDKKGFGDNAETVQGERLNSGEEEGFERHELLLFYANSNQQIAADMKDIFRLEEFDTSSVQMVGDQEVVLYRNATMPIYNFAAMIGLVPARYGERLPTLIVEHKGKPFGFIVAEILNLSSEKFSLHGQVTDRDEIRANIILDGQIYPYIDMDVILNKIDAKQELQKLGYMNGDMAAIEHNQANDVKGLAQALVV